MEFKIILEPKLVMKGDGFILDTPAVFMMDNNPVVIPAGFYTDFASVPKVLRWYIDNDQKEVRNPAIWHDAAYGGDVYVRSRADADAIFRDFCLSEGLPFLKAWTAWAALRLGGRSHWKKVDWVKRV